jgi:dTDP-4-dehydrorhamnose 3,5-epimerase-like enzyme
VGEIFDAAADIRHTIIAPPSASVAVRSVCRKQRMLWVPVGFVHGFDDLRGREVLYKTTDY